MMLESVTFSPLVSLSTVDIIVEIIFGTDITLRFFHEYKDPESFEIVTELRRIVKRYLK